jgi:hypothetical protein
MLPAARSAKLKYATARIETFRISIYNAVGPMVLRFVKWCSRRLAD